MGILKRYKHLAHMWYLIYECHIRKLLLPARTEFLDYKKSFDEMLAACDRRPS